MKNKKGWSALEYLIMTVAIVTALIIGAQRIQQAVGTHINTVAGQIESAGTGSGR
jgi:Flp pilus assembly pilin Flp